MAKTRRENKITNIRNGKGKITGDPINTKQIIRKYYKLPFYSNKFDNLDKINNFLLHF